MSPASPVSGASPSPLVTPGVVIFAHVPPPHHGQSYAVQLLLEYLGKAARGPAPPLRVFHVDARLSDDIDAIGRFQPGKIVRLLKYCLQAIAFRVRHGARILYYIPAAPMRSAVYRDWVVMLLCRCFFDRVVFHWEAAGLAEWLRCSAKAWEHRLTHRLLDGHATSVVLAEYGRVDAEDTRAREVCVVPNGIPDPCPDYDSTLHGVRLDRQQQFRNAWTSTPERALDPPRRSPNALRKSAGPAPNSPEFGEPSVVCRLLYLSLCIPEKGLFDAVDATALLNAEAKTRGARLRVRLTVAGKFWREDDRARFEERLRAGDLALDESVGEGSHEDSRAVSYVGFVGPEQKDRLFRGSDVFLFPSYYSAESFGLAVAEAMAYGLPVVAARWRHLPELFPEGYPFLVDPKAPSDIARALSELFAVDKAPELRRRFLDRYTADAYGRGLEKAILGIR